MDENTYRKARKEAAIMHEYGFTDNEGNWIVTGHPSDLFEDRPKLNKERINQALKAIDERLRNKK